ncbi:Methylmalonyl-CoA mutase small subunit [compost metagenome]
MNVRGFIEADILENLVLRGCKIDITELAEIIHLTKSYPNFQSLTIRSHAFVNAGSNTTQELAFTLNKLVDYIDLLSEAGLTPVEVINKLQFHMAISGDYFFEIAKLRAMRILLNSLMNLYGCNASVKILSSNSVWSKSFYDPNVNMLRNTSEAMSAILGGCDALLTYPHDYSFQEPSPFSQRIALNVSNLLKSESYFDKVNDPSAGSYYQESLTKNIADTALNLFKETENAGGFINAYKAGLITEKINKIRDLKEKEIAARKRVYVGVNKYPDLQEKTPLDSHVTSAHVLRPQRATKLFEELKSKTIVDAQKSGKTPSVYLACFGDLAMRKARASFASEFFGTAGFDIIEEAFFKTSQQAVEISSISEADIVVICSSDSEYETEAAAFATKFKSLSKGKLLVLAGYPESIVNELMNSGIDGFIHLRSNAIDVLTAFQKMINP